MRVFHQNESCLPCPHPPLSYEGRREQASSSHFDGTLRYMGYLRATSYIILQLEVHMVLPFCITDQILRQYAVPKSGFYCPKMSKTIISLKLFQVTSSILRRPIATWLWPRSWATPLKWPGAQTGKRPDGSVRQACQLQAMQVRGSKAPWPWPIHKAIFCASSHFSYRSF